MDKKPTVVGLFRNAKETRKVDAGAVIFNEGDAGTEMFGIIDGEVELRAKNGVLGRLGPEDIFGEMALIDDSPRSLTAVAVSDITLATKTLGYHPRFEFEQGLQRTWEWFCASQNVPSRS